VGLLITAAPPEGASHPLKRRHRPSRSAIPPITATPRTATIGTEVQFTVTATGRGSFSAGVRWGRDRAGQAVR
jgi:hypothetical protein